MQLAHAYRGLAASLVEVADLLETTPTPAPDTPVTALYLTTTAYAQRHDVSARTVRRWLVLGLPHHKAGARVVRIHVSDADAWIEAGGANERSRPRTIKPRTKKAADR